MCTHVYVCACVCIFSVHVNAHTSACVFVSMCVSAHVCVCMSARMCMCMGVCVCMCAPRCTHLIAFAAYEVIFQLGSITPAGFNQQLGAPLRLHRPLVNTSLAPPGRVRGRREPEHLRLFLPSPPSENELGLAPFVTLIIVIITLAEGARPWERPGKEEKKKSFSRQD